MHASNVQSDDDAASAPGNRSSAASSSATASAAAASPAIGGGGDMMSEMAKRLRDRKAKAEMSAQVNVGDPQCINIYITQW